MPNLLVSWVDVAVTVTDVVVETVGAVSRPPVEIEPALADHVTVELKLPVPVKVAEHWLIPPDCTVDGVQLTVTELIVDPPLPLLPPQAAMSAKLPTTISSPTVRTDFSSLDIVSGSR
jgi:hypothetical protein